MTTCSTLRAVLAGATAATVATSMSLPAQGTSPSGWEEVAGDPGGQRWVASAQIDRDTVRDLRPAGTYLRAVAAKSADSLMVAGLRVAQLRVGSALFKLQAPGRIGVVSKHPG